MRKEKRITKLKKEAMEFWEKVEVDDRIDLFDLNIEELSAALTELNQDYYMLIYEDDSEAEELPEPLQKILKEHRYITVPFPEFEDNIRARTEDELMIEYAERVIDEIITIEEQDDVEEEYMIFSSVFGSEEIYEGFDQGEDAIEWAEVTIEHVPNVNNYYLVARDAYGIIEVEKLD